MKDIIRLRNLAFYSLVVALDVTIIQLFRYFTPVIIWLRLGFIFIVLSASVYVFYVITKPQDANKAGVIYSLFSFGIALAESYLVHVVIEHGNYKLLYLLPSSFALLLPFLLARGYQKFHSKKSQ